MAERLALVSTPPSSRPAIPHHTGLACGRVDATLPMLVLAATTPAAPSRVS